jgi:putative ABC transport system permease protein
MVVHNLKQIFRGLWRYKSFSLINLLGLSIGIAAVLLLFMISGYEKSFDNLHSGDGQLYRVVKKSSGESKDDYSAAVPYPTARLFRAEYAGAQATQVHFAEDMNIRIEGQAPFREENVLFADSLFFKVLDFAHVPKFRISGNPAAALMEPRKALLTEATARRYFASADPVGRIIRLDNRVDVEVAGVIKDVSASSHLPFTMIVSYSSLTPEFNGGIGFEQWGVVSGGYCYLRLNSASDVKAAENALKSIVQKNGANERDRRDVLYLQPLEQIHFDPQFEASNPSYTVSPRYLTMLILLGGFIILIACVNYINLSTSFAFAKSKEVGIRKTIGATRTQLFLQYMLETLVLTTVAAIIGVTLALLLLPTVNQMLDKSIPTDLMLRPGFIAGGIGGLLLVSFISGVYPALILAGFNPIVSLKNQVVTPGRSSALLRKGLVVFQFATSIVLIICTIVIARQMHYSYSKELGFNKDSVVEVALPEPDSARIEKFRSLLQNQAGIESFSFCLGAPISENGFSTSLSAPGVPKDADYNVSVIPSDREYLKTYDMKLVAGRWFHAGEEKNLGQTIVVNETLVKTLGFKSPAEALGKQITIGINNYSPTIVGVSKDFHTSSLHENIPPVGMMPFPYFYYAAGIRISPGALSSSLQHIASAWKQVYPESVYELRFIDETLAESYEQETRDFNLFKAFSVISIFICCIGLWGLIAFVVVRKIKEIGIRKVLGASAGSIVFLLSKDFLKLVAVALLVASPLAWYFMHNWLQDFSYRVDLSWWIFAAAGLFAIVLALITVSFQTIRAALANPVKNLRTE